MRETAPDRAMVIGVALAGNDGLAQRAKIPDVASLIRATLAEFCVATEFRDVPREATFERKSHTTMGE